MSNILRLSQSKAAILKRKKKNDDKYFKKSDETPAKVPKLAVVDRPDQPSTPPFSHPSSPPSQPIFEHLSHSEPTFGLFDLIDPPSPEKEDNWLEKLRCWVVQSDTDRTHVNGLLKILKLKIPEVPVSYQTLLRTPRNLPVCFAHLIIFISPPSQDVWVLLFYVLISLLHI